MCGDGPTINTPSISDVVNTVTDVARTAINVGSGGIIDVGADGSVGVGGTARTAVSLASLGTADLSRNGSISEGTTPGNINAAGKWIEQAAHDTGHFIERGVREGSESLTGVAARRQMTEQANNALNQAEADRNKQLQDAQYRSMTNDRQASNIAGSGRSGTSAFTNRQSLGGSGNGSFSNNTFLGL